MADVRILQGLRGHVEIPEGASILGSIEIPNGVDVRISFEEIEGGWRLYAANAGQVQSIDLLHGKDLTAAGFSVINGMLYVTFTPEEGGEVYE